MTDIIKPSEHAFIPGRTGSGKTYLATEYLARFDNVVILDTKGLLKWPQVDPKELAVVTKLANISSIRKPKIIYRPIWEELNPEYFNAFYEWVYRRKNTVCYTDEIMSVCPSPLTYPPYLKAIMTRGRERKTAAWNSTQRPSGIPVIVMSESTHFFVFDLNMPQDREKLVQVSGCKEFAETPFSRTGETHNFWYWRADRAAKPGLFVL